MRRTPAVVFRLWTHFPFSEEREEKSLSPRTRTRETQILNF